MILPRFDSMRGLGGYIILKIAVVLLGRKLHGLGGVNIGKFPV
jgi:hypothetical protein